VVELIEIVAQRLQRPWLLRAAQADDEPVRRAGLQLLVERRDRAGPVDIQGDDAGNHRHRPGGPDDLCDPVEAVDLPTGQPDRRVPELLGLRRFPEIRIAGRDIQRDADRPQTELAHAATLKLGAGFKSSRPSWCLTALAAALAL
jgi:hypothetical protein